MKAAGNAFERTAHERLAALPRVALAPLPTPLEDAPRLARALAPAGAAPRILIKRDDLTGLAMGGNKVRKLEYHLGEALAQGCDVLVTTGAIQSNHCRVTAAAARKAGLEAVLVLRPGESEAVQGNLLLDHLLGAHVRIAAAPDPATMESTIAGELDALRRGGRKPYLVPKGASTPLGAAAYLAAFLELSHQAASTSWASATGRPAPTSPRSSAISSGDWPPAWTFRWPFLPTRSWCWKSTGARTAFPPQHAWKPSA